MYCQEEVEAQYAEWVRGQSGAADAAAAAVEAAARWAPQGLDGSSPPAAIAFGAGPAWAAALEAALVLAEIAMVPAQGMEVREGATTAMYPLGSGQLVLSLPGGAARLSEEAEAVCAGRGAAVLRTPELPDADPRLAPLSGFAAPLALAVLLAQRDGLDPDTPDWHADYLATARRDPT
jgi:fructoselysine-6-P-deglycase FrlB-like protein